MPANRYRDIAKDIARGRQTEPVVEAMGLRGKRIQGKPGKRMGGYLDMVFGKRMEREKRYMELE